MVHKGLQADIVCEDGLRSLADAAVAARRVHMADAMLASYRKFWFDKGYPVAVLLNSPLLSSIWTLYSGIRAIAPWRTFMAALVQVLLYGVQKGPEGRGRGMAAIW